MNEGKRPKPSDEDIKKMFRNYVPTAEEVATMQGEQRRVAQLKRDWEYGILASLATDKLVELLGSTRAYKEAERRMEHLKAIVYPQKEEFRLTHPDPAQWTERSVWAAGQMIKEYQTLKRAWILVTQTEDV